MTLNGCVGRRISVVCDIEKHKGIHQNKIVIVSQDGGLNESKNLKHKLQNEMQGYTLINSGKNLVLSHQQKNCVLIRSCCNKKYMRMVCPK